jgi:hypothetical protein
MTPHPLKTALDFLERANAIVKKHSPQYPPDGLDGGDKASYEEDAWHFFNDHGDQVAVPLRAIMGQDVDVEMLIHEIIGATQIPPGTTSRHYLRQAIGHLHSTGRICEVPDGWVMMPRELTDDVIDAGRKAWKEYVRENPNWQSGLNASKRTRLKYRIRYKAMIAASTPGGGDNG